MGGVLDLPSLLVGIKLDQKKWFLFFLVFNLLGIPEMIYLKKQGQKLLRRP